MANIQAIEKSVMTTVDEKMLKQMAESMPFEIYQQLSPEARSRLANAYGKEVPASAPYTGVLPMKKAHRALAGQTNVTIRVDLTREDIDAIKKVTQGKKSAEDWVYETIVFKLEEMGAYGKE